MFCELKRTLIETVLLSTHSICLYKEIREDKPPLFGSLVRFYSGLTNRSSENQAGHLRLLVTTVVRTRIQNRAQSSRKECVIENHFSYFSTKAYVVGTQKNRHVGAVRLGTQNTCFN